MSNNFCYIKWFFHLIQTHLQFYMQIFHSKVDLFCKFNEFNKMPAFKHPLCLIFTESDDIFASPRYRRQDDKGKNEICTKNNESSSSSSYYT